MTVFKFDSDMHNSHLLPEFSIQLNEAEITTLYSDVDIQSEFIHTLLENTTLTVLDREDGLYERLTVQDNVTFFHKWFNCQIPLVEVLVLFELHKCAKKPLKQCTLSEIRRVYFAKYFLMDATDPLVFKEPIFGVDILTINTFMNMLQKLKEANRSVLVLVTNLEHALLLGDVAYQLQERGLEKIEVEEEKEQVEKSSEPAIPQVENLYKVPVTIDDKVILFDPPEIDYIESQGGQTHIVINDESFTLGSTLIEIEKRLKVYGFYRCHRSYIVNLQKVREIITWSKNTYSLRIDNKIQSTIPLSRTKIQEIKDLFNLK